MPRVPARGFHRPAGCVLPRGFYRPGGNIPACGYHKSGGFFIY